MLPAWILEIVNVLTCRSFAAPFIASQLCTILALWSVWRLGRTVLDERLALLGAFALLHYSFFTMQSTIYNQNNALIAFWCLSIYLTFQALQTNRKRYWITAGIALGLTFHAKYPAVFLVLSILIYMFTRENGRKLFRTPGPWITTLIAFLIFLPHLIWLFYYDFVSITYAAERQVALPQWHQQVLAPLYFTAGQLLYWIQPLVILIPVIGFAWKWKIQYHAQSRAKECEKFLFYCFMIPLVCHILYCGIKGVPLRPAYGAPFWVFIGLWFLLRFQTKITLQSFRQTVALVVGLELLIIVGFIATFYMGKQSAFVYYPMRELGATCSQIWNAQFPNNNCPYVSGIDDGFTGRNNCGLIGFVAYSMSDNPSALLAYGTWANDDDLNRKGGMIIWERDNEEKEMPEELRQRFPNAEVLPEAPELPYKVGRKPHVLRIGIALVPPPKNP